MRIQAIALGLIVATASVALVAGSYHPGESCNAAPCCTAMYPDTLLLRLQCYKCVNDGGVWYWNTNSCEAGTV